MVRESPLQRVFIAQTAITALKIMKPDAIFSRVISVPAAAAEGPPLNVVGQWAQADRCKIYMDSTSPLEQAGAAQEENCLGRALGRVVLRVNAAQANRKSSPAPNPASVLGS